MIHHRSLRKREREREREREGKGREKEGGRLRSLIPHDI